MKIDKFVMSAILIFALTNYAFGMGRHHHRDHGSTITTDSGGSTTTNNNTGGIVVTYQHNEEGGGTFQANNNGGSQSEGSGFTFQGGNNCEGFVPTSQFPGGPVNDPVPEPATMLLLGSGLIGLAGYARRRFKK